MSLDTASLLDILKTGVVPPQLAGTGITIGMVRQYVSTRNGMNFARVNDTMMTPQTASAVGRYRKEGIGYLKGLGHKEQLTQLATLANGLRLGTGHAFEADFQQLKIEASLAGVFKSPRGRGAGRSISKKSPFAAPAPSTGQAVGETGEYIGVNESSLRGAFAATPNMVAPAEQARRIAIANASGDAEQMAENVGTVLRAFADKMSQLATAAAGGQVGKAKRAK